MDFSAIENKIGYTFKDKRLLERAFTLSSVSSDNNENLECFGDAVLEFIVTEKLYFECSLESEITVRRKNAVSDEALCAVSKALGLDGFLIKGKGDTNNKKAVPSVYEALTAAIYLDGGLIAAKKFVLATVNLNAKVSADGDYKSRLQEILQSRGESLPEYTRVELGDAQHPDFTAEVSAFGRTFSGRGASAKAAEKAAAKRACEFYEGSKS